MKCPAKYDPPCVEMIEADRSKPENVAEIFAVQTVTILFNDIRIKRWEAALRRQMDDYAINRIAAAANRLRKAGE